MNMLPVCIQSSSIHLFPRVAVLHLFVIILLSLSVVRPGYGESFEDAKDQFQSAFSSGDYSQQRKSITTLGQYDKKEAFDLIKREMLNLGQRLWKIENAFKDIDRRSLDQKSWTDRQKQAFQIHDSGQLKKIRQVFRTGTEQLKQSAKPEWIFTFVKRLGMDQVSLSSLYVLMKGKLLVPLAEISNRHAHKLLLDVLRKTEMIRKQFKQQKRQLNNKINSYSHEKSLKKMQLRKPALERRGITRRISILDVLRRQVYNNLSKLDGEEAVNTLVEYGLKSDHFQVRAASAYALGFQKDTRSRNALIGLLKNEKRYQVQIELLRAIGKRAIQSAENEVQPFLEQHRIPVQYAAAHVLGRIGTLESTDLLIKRMEELKSGRLYHEIVDSLSYMTGQTFGADTEAWRKWYQKHQDDSLAPPTKRQLPDEARRGHDLKGKSSTEFYGMPLTSNNVMFVVDASLSMDDTANYTGSSAGFDPGGSGPKIPTLPENPSRMNVARNQLMKAIKGLKRNQMFNIIFFAGFNTVWNKQRMVPATPQKKKEAFSFIKNAGTEWATVIYEAIELGFDFGTVGPIPVGEQQPLNAQMTKLAPDTIILVSDGKPAYGQYDMRNETGTMYNNLFQRVNKMNQFRLLKMYAVSIGNKEFFQKFLNRTMYYPDPKQRPEWWIQPGIAVGR